MATGPACPTWPAIAAPVSWIASASRVSPASGVVPDDDLLAVGPALGRDREVGDGRQPDPAARDGEVVVDQLVGHLAVRRAPLEGRGLHRAVAQPDRAERGGGEDVRSGHVRQSRTRYSSGRAFDRPRTARDGEPGQHRELVVAPAAALGLERCGASRRARARREHVAGGSARRTGPATATACGRRCPRGRSGRTTTATCAPAGRRLEPALRRRRGLASRGCRAT